MKGLVFAISLLCVCLVSVAIAQNSERFLIKIFTYGPADTEEQRVTSHLQARLWRLRQQELSVNPKLTTLQKLTVEIDGHPIPNNPEALWKGNEAMLEFLTGEYYPDEKKIVNDIYVGEDNKGFLQGPMITVRTEDTSEDYDLRNDLVCAVTLYALAMDGVRVRADSGVIAGYLGEAWSKLTLAPPGLPLDENENTLREAVMRELEILKQNSRNP